MASIAYTRGLEAVLSGAVNLGAVTVKAMLTTAAYAENKNTHAFRSDVAGEVAAGAGYAAGGVNVAVAVTRDETNSRVNLSLGSFSITVPAGATLTARKVVYYVSAGAASADRLLAVNDLGADVSATNQALNVAATVVRVNN